MSPENPTIIADDQDGPAPARAATVVFTLSVALGSVAAWYYARLGLTLSHYDARAHLVVARRVVDSLTPGWRQLGAVWLPLPHVLNLLPMQWDWNFQTGFSAVALSICTFAWGLAALSRYLLRHTGSLWVAIVAPLIALANPSVLYLQSTPLTEPMLFGLSLVSLAAVDGWIGRPERREARRAGTALAALVLTRYEGWLIAALLVAFGFAARPKLRRGGPLIFYPAAAAAAFFCLSYFSSGVLLVTSGFYTPDNPARGAMDAAIAQILTTTGELAGPAVMAIGAVGLLVAIARIRDTRGRSALPLALLGAAALPLGAFHAGHPERVRYMVILVVAFAAIGGLALAPVPGRLRPGAAGLLLALALWLRPPFASTGPMLEEAQWELPFQHARRAVTAYLRSSYDGTPILASMGSLAHYMQEVSASGLSLRDFLHEGNGDLWTDALSAPSHHVHWILIEEQALGGDMLARRVRQDPAFLDGFARVSSGGGLALYRRTR